MNVTIDSPELERLIEQEVRSGRYPSAEAVVVAALAQLKADLESDEEFDDATAEDLRESIEQAARGQTLTIDEAAAQLGVTVDRKRGRSGAA